MIKKYSIRECYDIRASTIPTIIIDNTIFKDFIFPLTQERYETNGILITSPSGNLDVVNYVAKLNNPYSEYATGLYDKKKLSSLNDLMEIKFEEGCKNLRGIAFHTHTLSTGNYWVDKFSSGDLNTFEKEIERDPSYRHILFTPSFILTYSKDSIFKVKLDSISIKKEELLKNYEDNWNSIFNDLLEYRN